MDAKLRSFCDLKKKNQEHHSELGMDYCLSPFTILIGPNGTGKTRSLLNIESECKERGIKCIKYSNKHEDIVQKAGLDWDPYKLMCAFHSEGERIDDSFYNWGNTIMIKELLGNDDDIFILIDELDSGLSIDKLNKIIKDLCFLIKYENDKHPKRFIYFVLTCNSFEMLDCINKHAQLMSCVYFVPTKKIMSIKTYNNFIKPFIDYSLYMNEEEK